MRVHRVSQGYKWGMSIGNDKQEGETYDPTEKAHLSPMLEAEKQFQMVS